MSVYVYMSVCVTQFFTFVMVVEVVALLSEKVLHILKRPAAPA